MVKNDENILAQVDGTTSSWTGRSCCTPAKGSRAFSSLRLWNCAHAVQRIPPSAPCLLSTLSFPCTTQSDVSWCTSPQAIWWVRAAKS